MLLPKKAIIIAGPSGVGKTTVVHHLLDKYPLLCLAVSACTRSRRSDEVHGQDYYFLKVESFQASIQQHQFLEWEEVYPGHYYGTLKTELQRIQQLGKIIIFDIDVHGTLKIKSLFQQNVLSIYLSASQDRLHQRLTQRNTHSLQDLTCRLAKAQYERRFSSQFDQVLDNTDLAITLKKTQDWVQAFIKV